MQRASLPFPWISLSVLPLLVLGLGSDALAEVEFVASERAATIHAEAADYYIPGNPMVDSCDDARTWNDAVTIDDLLLLCTVSPGYGYATCRTRITSVVAENGFSTTASGSGGFNEDNFFMTTGSFEATYRQTYDFHVTESAVLYVSGTLWQEYGSLSEFTLLQGGTSIAYFSPPPQTHEAQISLDEQIQLGAGDYRCVLNILGLPLPQDTYGGASASIDVTITAPISVEPLSWSRIKSFYRQE